METNRQSENAPVEDEKELAHTDGGDEYLPTQPLSPEFIKGNPLDPSHLAFLLIKSVASSLTDKDR